MYHMAVIALRVLACPERSGGWDHGRVGQLGMEAQQGELSYS